MIEQIMFFVLGVLCATLVALLVMPAIWQRAVRLTTRRIEATMPASLFEVQADKDIQRAEFALAVRRLELQVDDLRNQIAADARTLERLRLKDVESERVRTALSAAIDALGGERDTLAAELAAARAALEEQAGTSAEASAADAAREREEAEARQAVDGLRTRLEAAMARAEGLERRLARSEEAFALLREERRSSAPSSEDLDMLRSALIDVAARIVAATPGVAVPAEANGSQLAERMIELRRAMGTPPTAQPAADQTGAVAGKASMAGP